jgi:amino acid permease
MRAAMALLSGIALIVDTYVLFTIAWVWSVVFNPIFAWAASFQYGKAPVLDIGLMTPIPGIFYGLLLFLWFALVACLIYALAAEVDYGYGAGP